MNTHKSHHFLPLVIVIPISNIQNETVLTAAAATTTSLPNHLYRSGLARQALVLVAWVEKRDESEDEPGEAEHDAEPDEQDGWSESGRGLARVEELGG